MDIIALVNNAVFALTLNFLVGLVGAASHFAKKRFKGQTEAAIRDWVFSHPIAVGAAMLAYVIAFLYGIKEGGFTALTNSSLAAAWGLGYIADSMFNKSDGDAEA